MTPLERYVGQTLDQKYRLERLLGQGGMGAVYLATHLGTERYVALKLITPRFMRNQEFVERFKREARAAGRLRHPNVVDVTDFGFAQVDQDRVAYLVMEYLDGCTLSDVLAEENRLPLYWVVDIIEQVCGAVHEAHQQGIVHRDLKPDNIWLEPNRLGGYRVKVLDFGIAKLAEVSTGTPEPFEPRDSPETTPTMQFAKPAPAFAVSPTLTQSESTRVLPAPASNLETETIIQSAGNDHTSAATPAIEDEAGTRLLDQRVQPTAAAGNSTMDPLSTAATAGLTRVGAILGTPLYMSPEQCRGESLDARSDIYSLGIITYQMLAGSPPFTGETTTIIRAHNETAPIPIRVTNKKLPKRVARVIMSALEKDPAARPQTAMALANSLRANADGLGTLYRRAFSLYTEYFPEFFKLSLIAHIPMIIVTLMFVALRLMESRLSKLATFAIGAPLGLLLIGAQFLTASTISGITAIIVTQLVVAPMKPVRVRAAFDILRRRWRPFLNTGFRIMLRILLGWLLIIPGIVITIRYWLWAPVVLMEGLEKKAARQRARSLAARSWRTIIAALLIQLLVPAIVGAVIGAVTGASSHGKATVSVKVTSQLSGLVNIFILPLLSIVPALLYLKMRQLGGETINDVMAMIDDEGAAHSKWQQRMRTRLTVTPQTRTPI
jgi:serine/threonine protein kinase